MSPCELELSPTPESVAYDKLIALIDDIEADPDLNLAKVLENECYPELIAKLLSVEVVSLYVASPDAAEGGRIEFLNESMPSPLNLPMFVVNSDEKGNRPFTITKVDLKEVIRRRNEQTRILRSSQERLSAELCARYLQKDGNSLPENLLLPFGEILTYCFLFHIIEGVPPDVPADELLWQELGQMAWNKLCQAYGKPGIVNQSDVERLLLDAIKNWYFRSDVDRAFLGPDKVQAVYCLNAEMSSRLSTLEIQSATTNTDFPNFLESWSRVLYDSLRASSSENNLKDLFWHRTLVNPYIEEMLRSRGLYVTIIRSPLSTKEFASSHLSHAYAICTIYDTDGLNKNDRRVYLDKVLRRLAHEDLAKYDFLRLKRTDDHQDRILDLLNAVSESDYNCQELMQEAAKVSLHVSNADGVLIGWSDIGTTALIRNGEETYKMRWFSYLSALHTKLRRLSDSLPQDHAQKDKMSDHNYKRLIPILRNLAVKSSEIKHVCAFSFGARFGKRPGTFILFSNRENLLSSDTRKQLEKIMLSLAVGMVMPFRSAGKGLLSWMLGVVCHPLENILLRIARRPQKVWFWLRNRNTMYPRRLLMENPKVSTHRLLNWAIASIVEITQVGFVAVALLFLGSVFSIIFYTLRHLPPFDYINAHLSQVACQFLHLPQHLPEEDITLHIVQTVRNIEHTVMAFSICLATNGVIFLLKPDLAANLPLWMRGFAKLGTLEKTLVRLAAMVLTIDVLAVVLEASPIKGNNALSFAQLQPILIHVSIYLVVLVGLAFLSKLLLNEDSDNHPPKEND